MKYNDNGTYKDIYVKAFDTLPVGTEVDYDGETVPTGWTQVDDEPVYSTTEQRVGTWIDGKPLYSKYVKIPNPSAISGSGTVSQNFPHGISNLKRCVDVINPVFVSTGQGYQGRFLNIPVLSGSSGYLAVYEVDNTNITLRSRNESWSASWDLECILVYTKDTD